MTGLCREFGTFRQSLQGKTVTYIPRMDLSFLAGGRGFEPRLPGPEPGVLPLNYPPRG